MLSKIKPSIIPLNNYPNNPSLSFLFKVIKKAGSNTKLQIIAISNVIETKIPKDCVPLNDEAVKIKKPVNKIMAV